MLCCVCPFVFYFFYTTWESKSISWVKAQCIPVSSYDIRWLKSSTLHFAKYLSRDQEETLRSLWTPPWGRGGVNQGMCYMLIGSNITAGLAETVEPTWRGVEGKIITCITRCFPSSCLLADCASGGVEYVGWKLIRGKFDQSPIEQQQQVVTV